MEDYKVIKLDSSNIDERIVGGINHLLPQLAHGSNTTVSDKDILGFIESNLSMYICLDDENIVGMACCVIIKKPLEVLAQLEDIVVDQNHRQKGVARMLISKIINDLPENCIKVYAISGNTRPEAHKMYENMGFKIKNSSVFYLELSS